MKPPIVVLRAAGVNCDAETVHALEVAGGAPETVHVNELVHVRRMLSEYRMLVIPGGFTYGDDVSAGKILANELRAWMADHLDDFIGSGGLVLGICNGFQVLVKTGLLPDRMVETPLKFVRPTATLAANSNGRFQCRWVRLLVQSSAAPPFLSGLDGRVLEMPIAHGEGRFTAPDEVLQSLAAVNIPFRYCGPSGELDESYNANGSALHAAGISGFGGRVLGLMPHPERHIYRIQHPQWTRRTAEGFGDGMQLFRNAVAHLNSC